MFRSVSATSLAVLRRTLAHLAKADFGANTRMRSCYVKRQGGDAGASPQMITPKRPGRLPRSFTPLRSAPRPSLSIDGKGGARAGNGSPAVARSCAGVLLVST